MDLSGIKRVHMVGAGGIGMSGLVLLAHEKGLHVTGSDKSENHQVQYLRASGIDIALGHDAKRIDGVDAVVYSSAIAQDNVELQAANRLGISLMHRADFLALMMQGKRQWLVAGSHGKTTTSSLLTHVWRESALFPSYAIGGVQLNGDGVAKMDVGPDFLAEADESDGSFLKFSPDIAIVTNIGADHLDNYDNDFANIKEAFGTFIGRIPEDGVAVLCIDDPVVRECISTCSVPMITYGQSAEADFRLCNTTVTEKGTRLQIKAPVWGEVAIEVPLFGVHNALNTLAVLACAHKRGLSLEAIQKALLTFKGVSRRFQFKGTLDVKEGHVDWYDDYGHHPTELEAVIRTVRGRWPDKPLTMCFQPHRYTRTQSLFQAFVDVLALCDSVVLCPTYSAGEASIEGFDEKALYQALEAKGIPVSFLDDWAVSWQERLKPGSVFLTQGAGDVLQRVELLCS